MSDMRLDGNALAGPLGELFTMDVTMAHGSCAGCGQKQMMAETVVYERGPGAVARCRSCDTVLLRMVRGPGRAWLDLRGMTYIEVPMPDAGG